MFAVGVLHELQECDHKLHFDALHDGIFCFCHRNVVFAHGFDNVFNRSIGAAQDSYIFRTYGSGGLVPFSTMHLQLGIQQFLHFPCQGFFLHLLLSALFLIVPMQYCRR